MEVNDPPREGDDITPTDYANPDNWAKVEQCPCLPVDVFFLYPTTYQGEEPLAGINDEQMRTGADEWLRISGCAFAVGNVYMPYYRQLDAMWVLKQDPKEQIAFQRGAPKTDVLAAFEYYLKHFNCGRPFILASHSQGSTMNKEILFDYFVRNPDVARRMVASYVIGYSVTEEDFDRNPNMKFANGPDDTGVIISHNTVTPGADPSQGTLILPGTMAINPLTWTRANRRACPCRNLGSFVDTGSGHQLMQGLADAKVDTIDGKYEVVICSTADFEKFGTPPETIEAFGTGSFHNNDIGFYHCNLLQNAENRARRFLQTRSC